MNIKKIGVCTMFNLMACITNPITKNEVIQIMSGVHGSILQTYCPQVASETELCLSTGENCPEAQNQLCSSGCFENSSGCDQAASSANVAEIVVNKFPHFCNAVTNEISTTDASSCFSNNECDTLYGKLCTWTKKVCAQPSSCTCPDTKTSRWCQTQ